MLLVGDVRGTAVVHMIWSRLPPLLIPNNTHPPKTPSSSSSANVFTALLFLWRLAVKTGVHILALKQQIWKWLPLQLTHKTLKRMSVYILSLAVLCSPISSSARDVQDVFTRLWSGCHHCHPTPSTTTFTNPTLHHCSVPAADAQLQFSRGALTSPPPPSQSSALFILSNIYCLARGGHFFCLFFNLAGNSRLWGRLFL